MPKSSIVIYKGRRFSSYKDLCAFYNVDYVVFRARKKLGFDLDKCLEPLSLKNKLATDGNGKEFNTIKELAEYYNVPKSTVSDYVIKYGYFDYEKYIDNNK